VIVVEAVTLSVTEPMPLSDSVTVSLVVMEMFETVTAGDLLRALRSIDSVRVIDAMAGVRD
jgi:hypothetical protein